MVFRRMMNTNHGLHRRFSKFCFDNPLHVSVLSTTPLLREHIQRRAIQDPFLNSLIESKKVSFSDQRGGTVVLADPMFAAELLNESLEERVDWVQCTFAGVNHILNNCQRRDYLLTRVGEGFGPQMAEFVMGTLFYFSLRINVMSAQQAIKSWDPLTLRDRMQLGGKTMVILGAGNIAGYIAKSAKSFGMRCVGLCSTLKEGDEMKQARTSVFDELSDNIACVSEADVIVNCLPSTPSTRGLLNLRSLSSCSKIPIFINVGRGDVISLPDIESALNRSFISFAILDVFPQEPLDPNDSLWKNPQVLISPHISAVSHPGLVADVFIPNLKRYLQGERLKHVVDLKKGY